MRFTVFIVLIVIMLFAVGQTSNSQTNNSTAEQEVRKLERAWLDAYERHDVKAMNLIVADDFIITFPDGTQQTKPQIMASLNAPPNPIKFYTEDVKARVYGDTVILIGRVITEFQRDGKTVKEQSSYTDTYVRRERRWQVVASHLSNVAAPQKPLVSSNSGQGRSLSSKNRIVSQENPTIVIDVSEQLRSIGIINFPLKKVAQVERYIFARLDESGRAQRLFIAQFESILPGVKGGYSFPSENATRIGQHDYQTQIGFFNFAQTIAANPGAEAEQTKAYLNRNGVQVDDDFLVARYARVASEDKRHELILFYLENLRDLGLTRAELEQGGSRASETEKVFAEFAARARQSFKVVDGRS